MNGFPKPVSHRDKWYLDKIRECDCIACLKFGPSEAAHTKNGGTGLKGSDYSAIPLCKECHTGNGGWHSGQETFMRKYPDLFQRHLIWNVIPILAGLRDKG